MKKILAVILSFCVFSIAHAADSSSFVVKQIKVIGLRRIKLATLYSYLPIKVGDTVDGEESDKIIEDIYHSGFFSNVSLSRQGDVLIITVNERPVISNVGITGNHEIKTKELTKILDGLGLKEGEEYNPFLISDIQNALLQQYFNMGRYNAQVDIKVTDLPRDRVGVIIEISEGSVAKIKQVNVVGNHAFSESTLQDQFKLSTPNLLSFFTKNDVYSQEKFSADLNSLENFYLNHGYIRYRLNSSQVSLNPGRDQVYINANIAEGPQYHISGYQFSGQTILTQQQLQKMVPFKKGDVFSRQQAIQVQKSVSLALGNKGYAHASVQILPSIDDKDKTVYLNFNVQPGERIYVRHVTFTDNYRTNDNVLRRLVNQVEGGLSSTKEINASKTRLLQLPYIRDVQMTTTPVSGQSNEEDVNYKVTEIPAASFSAGIGYSDAYGPLFTVALNQKNFLGTGNQVSINFNRTGYSTTYAVNYFNPFATVSGIGHGLKFSYQTYNSDDFNISNYGANTISVNSWYSIPISDHTHYQVGYGYDNVLIKDVSNSSSDQIKQFVDDHGDRYYQLNATLGWTYQNFDRIIMPTKGLQQRASLIVTIPISNESLRYYKADYNAKLYQPIHKGWIFNTRGEVGYGHGYGSYADDYPFFKNFYAGGIYSVRGYQANTLGQVDSNGDPLGGNILLDGSVALIFPNPFGHNLRTSWFFDGGQVFNSAQDEATGSDLGIEGLDFSQIRYSTGLDIKWLSPLGIGLEFALAEALNPSSTDDTEFFAFNVSAGA
jgi:outer membrane protein insertion porin family